MSERIAVIGLGYVGLPVALAFARCFPDVVGFDISERRVTDLRNGIDVTGECTDEDLRNASIAFSADPASMIGASLFVVTVPTPVDENRQPDLNAVRHASEMVGDVLKPGALVVYESTVYPGVTEDICGPILEQRSGLKRGKDFKLGYSPERANPGDKDHGLANIVKVVAGEDAESLERVSAAYSTIVPAGIHKAPSIRVAEAAKVIENIQRDLNIALMNELALIFDRLAIRTKDVLEAARTKWNFLPFSPGLVGGHCIGVDPYYLTNKAKSVGYYPQVILAGRRINDGMGAFIAQKLVKLLIQADHTVRGARVGILGATFKENVPDLRNSRVPDIVQELRQFGIEPLVHDPLADSEQAQREYGLALSSADALTRLDGLILAVPHRGYMCDRTGLMSRLAAEGILIDVKSALAPEEIPAGCTYWSL